MHYKQAGNNGKNDLYDSHLAEVLENFQGPQAFNGGGNGNGRRDNAICQQGGAADHAEYNCPPGVAPYKGVQGKDAAFTFIICPEGKNYVFNGSLKGKCPYYTGNTANHEQVADGVSSYYGLENIKWRCSDIAVDNTKRYYQTCQGYPVNVYSHVIKN